MTEIRFYHLQTQTLEQALPQILSKALSAGHRIVVKTASDSDATRLNDHLWTFRPDSFLPHGTAKDGHAADQPVYLTANDECPNAAKVLVLTGGADSETMDTYELCCEIFNGADPAAVSRAREKWQTYKQRDFTLTYWQQNEKGGWDKKG